jgi:hypothetical protein
MLTYRLPFAKTARRMQLGKSATSTDIVDSYRNSTVVDELNHVMNPVFDAVQNAQLPAIDVETVVSEELYNYVQTISTMYHDNPFHNL